MYSVKILADSISPAKTRLTTWELTYPRMVHAEVMTHRLFSRNAASSRAIPIEKMIQRVIDDPAMPVWWGKNQPGMQAVAELDSDHRKAAEKSWLMARDWAVDAARKLADLGVHKQITNRVIEPWMHITVILSGTNFDNFWHLRDTWPVGQPPGPAQPEFAFLVREMRMLYDSNVPVPKKHGEWHLPLIQEDESSIDIKDLIKISVGRCARVSYLTHDGKRDIKKDIELHDKLLKDGHFSPFEHCAEARLEKAWWGNFCGFMQYRKTIETEHVGDVPPSPGLYLENL